MFFNVLLWSTGLLPWQLWYHSLNSIPPHTPTHLPSAAWPLHITIGSLAFYGHHQDDIKSWYLSNCAHCVLSHVVPKATPTTKSVLFSCFSVCLCAFSIFFSYAPINLKCCLSQGVHRLFCPTHIIWFTLINVFIHSLEILSIPNLVSNYLSKAKLC